MDVKASQTLWILIAVLGFTIAVYAPIRNAGFVYDDQWFIVQNPAIRRVTPGLFFRQPQTVATVDSGLSEDVYRPLTTLSYAVDYQIAGLRSAWYHVENILLFLIDGLLLAWLAYKLLNNAWAALFAAALFLWHPANVQVAAWASQRSALLSGLGLLACTLCWFPDRSYSAPRLFAGLLAYFLALFSKETAVVFPVLYGAIDYAVNENEKGPRRNRRFIYGATIIGAAIYLTVRYASLAHWSQVLNGPRSWVHDAGLGLMAFPIYLGKLICPIGLRPSYDYPSFTTGSLLSAGACAAIYLLALGWTFRRSRIAFLTLAWIAAGLLPVLQIVPIRAFVADRFLFVPLMGLALGAGYAAMHNRILSVVLAAWYVALFGVTRRTVPEWSTEERLWAYGVRQEPSNGFAHLCYASAARDPRIRIEQNRLALAGQLSAGNRFAAANNLAFTYLQIGRPKDALTWARQALAQQPDDAHALYIACRASLELDDPKTAKQFLERLRTQLPADAPQLRFLSTFSRRG